MIDISSLLVDMSLNHAEFFLLSIKVLEHLPIEENKNICRGLLLFRNTCKKVLNALEPRLWKGHTCDCKCDFSIIQSFLEPHNFATENERALLTKDLARLFNGPLRRPWAPAELFL